MFLEVKFSMYLIRRVFVMAVSNKAADRTARMRRLICILVVRTWLELVFEK